VWQATALLTGLGLALIAGSLLLADRLGRSLVNPVTELSAVAGRLAEGDLSARADLQGPVEVRSVAAALNTLASRLGGIIEGEREALADLSHRLRTPLTALRLQAERSRDEEAGRLLVEQVERTQAAVDQLIDDVRKRGRDARAEPRTDLVEVVRSRLDFWSVLAGNQDRRLTMDLPDHSVILAAEASEVAAVLDALLGNVFAHTGSGVPFSVAVRLDGDTPVLEVCDRGPGFGSIEAVDRGISGAGSTGLGLDIARTLCERLGGRLDVGEGPDGGALVVARLGV
jgi:signal transduction histidine kinase